MGTVVAALDEHTGNAAPLTTQTQPLLSARIPLSAGQGRGSVISHEGRRQELQRALE